MGMKPVILLLSVVAQALSAPTGCVESCTSYHRFYQTSGAHQNADLTQAAAHLENLDFSKPGNWTEHNQYHTDGGNGRVYEEKGQYVEGPKRVRFYKKNYTSSYSTGNVNGADLSTYEPQYRDSRYRSQHVSDAQRAYNQFGSVDSHTQQREYGSIQSQHHVQTASGSTNAHSERLEDFGEHSGSAQVAQDASDFSRNTQGQNWSNVNSYKTDGGHGHVYEEEGQYVTGPKKVRYYKKNYTSGYRITGTPVHEVPTGVHEIQRELEKLHQEIGRDMHQISTTGGTVLSNIGQSEVVGIPRGDIEPVQTSHYEHQSQAGISSSATHHNAFTSNDRSVHLPYRSPSHGSYGTESRSSYERREGYTRGVENTPQYVVGPTIDYTQVHASGTDGYNMNTANTRTRDHRVMEQLRHAESSDMHRSSIAEDQHINSNMRQNVYGQNVASHSSTPGASHYREHWSSSSHTREASGPFASDMVHPNQEGVQYNSNQHGSYHQTEERGAHSNQYRENNYNSAYRTSTGNLATGTIDLGHVGHTADCDQDTVQQVQYGSRYHRKYKRHAKYDELSDMQQHQTEDLTQQNEDLTQQSEDLTQQSEDLTQQHGGFDDFTQQTSGKLEFGQHPQTSNRPRRPTSGQHTGDLTQQNEDLTQQNEDLTQQTTGTLEFGQQSQRPQKPTSANHHLEDLTQQTEDLTQQTGGFDDFTQQTSGKLEFGQQSQKPRKPTSGDQHLEGFTQENEDLTQQTGGFDDFTQQTSGNLEFGQQSQHSQKPHRSPSHNQHVEDLTQQTGGFDDFTQQTSGHLEFGQQSQMPRKPTSGNQHVEDLTQQSEDLTQQTGGFDDFTQQTSGHLGFGQYQKPRKPTTGNLHVEDLTQQNEDLTQQTGGFDDFTQQTSGKLEFGQQSQHSQKPQRPTSHNQHVEDLTQQTGGFDDFTQQTSGKLEFGEHTQKPQRPTSSNQHMEDLTQQNEDLTQQTGGFDDFFHPSGKPQNPTSSNQQMEDLTQQTGGFDDFTQQTSGKLEFGQHTQKPQRPTTGNQHVEDLTQQNEDLTQQTGGFDDFYHPSGKLEFGQQTQYPHQSWKPGTSNQHMEDLSQQTGGFDDFTQTGQLQFGQQTTNQKYEDLFQQSQEPGKWHKEDLTQQSIQHSQEMTQSNNNKIFNQGYDQESNTFGSGSHSEEPSGVTPLEVVPKPAEKPRPRPRYQRVGYLGNSQSTLSKDEDNVSKPGSSHDHQTSHVDSGDVPIANIFDSPAQVKPEAETDDLKKENLRGDQGLAKPTTEAAPKKPNEQTKVNAFNIERENGDQVNWLHKSNDATVGLQWHYTYHPSDLTNSEPVPSSYYPGLNYHSSMYPRTQRRRLFGPYAEDDEDMQQQTRPSAFSQQQTQDREIFADMYQPTRNTDSSHSQFNNHDQHETQNQDRFGDRFHHSINTEQSRSQYNNFDQNSELYQQSNAKELEQHSQLTQQSENTPKEVGRLEFGNQAQSGVKGHRRPRPKAVEPVLEPRILEAYGGGPYDATHSDDIYNKVTVNPSVTLPPLNAEDPWDIREKPRVMMTPVTEVIAVAETVEPEETTEVMTEMTTPPSFWGKLGHKITNTFDKAKEKARGIFG